MGQKFTEFSEINQILKFWVFEITENAVNVFKKCRIGAERNQCLKLLKIALNEIKIMWELRAAKPKNAH
jgi:hypothetical protein